MALRRDGCGPARLTAGHRTFRGQVHDGHVGAVGPVGLDAIVPTLNRNPLDIADEAPRPGKPAPEYIREQLLSGDLKFAVEDPDAPENWPRVLTIWRANLLGSSSKGNEYFLKHLLGTDNAVRADETRPISARRTSPGDDAPRASSTCWSAWTSG